VQSVFYGVLGLTLVLLGVVVAVSRRLGAWIGSVAMAAGLKTLELLEDEQVYPRLYARTNQLMEGLQQLADEAGIPFTTNHVGSMFGFFFTDAPQVTNFKQVMACDIPRFNRFFHGMLERGVYLAPASYEAGFLSAAHSVADIEETLDAAREVFALLKKG
jgi:glutamate-1-semialdehyde 2,1-aminomutase